MSVKLLTEHHLEFLSLKGGCTGSSRSTFIKIVRDHMSRLKYFLYLNKTIADNAEYTVIEKTNKIASCKRRMRYSHFILFPANPMQENIDIQRAIFSITHTCLELLAKT